MDENTGDKAFDDLLVYCRAFATVCLTVDPRPGPFHSPYGAFVDKRMRVEGWISGNHHEGLTYTELIEMVRLEAMTRASGGLLEGAALMVYVTGPNDEDRLVLQIETRKSKVTYFFRVSADGASLEEPIQGAPLLPQGLCFFNQPTDSH
jgi:hypothetical protein